MSYSLPPEKTLELCDKLSKIVEFYAYRILQLNLLLRLFPPDPNEQSYFQTSKEKRLMDGDKITMEELNVIGIDLIDIVNQSEKKTLPALKWVHALIGIWGSLPDGEEVRTLLGDPMPDNVTIRGAVTHGRLTPYFADKTIAAMREVFILLEPLLPWDEMPEFPHLYGNDLEYTYQEIRKKASQYLKDIDKVRRVGIRELERRSDDQTPEKKAPLEEEPDKTKYQTPLNKGEHLSPGEIAITDNVFRLEGEYWTIRYDGKTARFKDKKGLRYIAYLLKHPDEDFPAIELQRCCATTQELAESQEVRSVRPRELEAEDSSFTDDLSTRDEVHDEKALRNYRDRLIELREELHKAQKNSDETMATVTQHEIDRITKLLLPSLNLGKKSRTFQNKAEKARIAITTAIKRAYKPLKKEHAILHDHLEDVIYSGSSFSYKPREEIRWQTS